MLLSHAIYLCVSSGLTKMSGCDNQEQWVQLTFITFDQSDCFGKMARQLPSQPYIISCRHVIS